MTEDTRDDLDLENAPESGSYKIDLDDTMSNLDAVMQEAMAAVDDNDKPPAAEEDQQAKNAEKAESQEEEVEHPAEILDFDTRDRLQRLQNESDTLRDRLARTAADFENFRKRAEREKANQQRYAVFNVLKEFLSVVDNLERAHAASGSAEDLKTGVAMIVRQFHEVLGRQGVQSVASVGEPFDPSRHEAVARHDSDEIEVPTVTIEHQKGYVLHDRLLRPSMVQVAMPTKPAPPKVKSVNSPENKGDVEAQSMAESADESDSQPKESTETVAAQSDG